MPDILASRDYYKPFQYPWAYKYYKTLRAMTWEPHEAPMMDDLKDWRLKLSEVDRQFLTQLFRFFTQADVDIAKGYTDKYLPRFGGHPELRMMFGAIVDQEANHQDAYSTLMDTLGIPDGEYKAFQSIKMMREKHEYMFDRESGRTIADLCADIACFSAFGEGLQLFSSFALLLNYQRRGLMKGMTTIVEWSIRDETTHVEAMLKVFQTLIEEHPRAWNDETKKRVYDVCRRMVELEDHFIDGCFSFGDIQGVTAAEAKLYIRYIADRRLLQLGLKPNYGVKENPFDWLDWITNAPTHTNFFEQRSTEYSKSEIEGWDKAFNFLDRRKSIFQKAHSIDPLDELFVDTANASPTAVYRVYTMPGCPHCVRAKEALDATCVPYETILIEDPDLRAHAKERFGWKSFPIVLEVHSDAPFERLVGGADALIAKLEARKHA
jgi:ribonucleoside-diphosphate reductase beta chain